MHGQLGRKDGVILINEKLKFTLGLVENRDPLGNQ